MLAALATGWLGVLPAPPAAANSAPGAPSLVSPASGSTISADAPQLFTIQTTDPDGDPYTGNVTVSDARTGRLFVSFSTAPASSGGRSSGAPSVPLPPGSYTWTASATDVLGNAGPQAASQPFTVAGAPDAGGGAVTGSASFSQPIPAIGQPCAATSFSLDGTSAAAVISFAQTAFAGPVTFTGSGGSSCESAGAGAGSIQLSAHGLGVTATTIDCPSLSGKYVRVGTDVTVTVNGLCTLNGTQTDAIGFDAKVELAPTGGGVDQPISGATYDGTFVVSPAT